LKDRIEQLIRDGYLKEYVRRTDRERRNRSQSPPTHRGQVRRASQANRIINTIVGRFERGGESSLARNRHLCEIMTIKPYTEKVKRHPVISFSVDNFCGCVEKQDDPMVISVEVKKITIK
jgi:hypothetical protein